MKKNLSLLQHRPVKFLIVGIINTIFGYCVYLLCLFALNLNASLSLALATMIGMCFNFYTTGHYVFINKDKSSFFRFILAYTFIYCINLILLKILVFYGISPAFSQLLILPIIAVISYLIFKKLVFRLTSFYE